MTTPQQQQKKPQKYKYLSGFGNHFETEALPDTLPKNQNTPQICPRGLYAEQLSGTSFTTPRHLNQRSWLYRILPSASHPPYKPLASNGLVTNNFSRSKIDPNQRRWKPLPIPEKPTDFVSGLVTYCGTGDPGLKVGVAIYLYAANEDMKNKAFFSADGDFLIVPELGTLDIQTEFGFLEVHPGEIAVIPRGILFSVKLPDGKGRGYITEIFEGHFRIPELGPIGANGLANPRDFLSPVAAYEDLSTPYTVINKFQGSLFETVKDHSPFNVVAWHGNYAPYKYDLASFCVVNTVSFDHLDPSIFTVLTCPTNTPGTACLDFVIFPARWSVADHTFRLPYYHRNTMSEFMGLIYGVYEAKRVGFSPGGATLHSCMMPHGPEFSAFDKGSKEELKPVYISGTLAFMFESSYVFYLTDFARENLVDDQYSKVWEGFQKNFDSSTKKESDSSS
eukprot:TRINITY_DN8469_c0_g1_i1.p1 TRINITY_DN8469_c0_g1~~TRINITY_DN8469_c0_g1_i1.p1  ORF type:complete len:465 (-),score=84.35 TRINITY_DN8469_c0_g1_i1:69-1415(-)